MEFVSQYASLLNPKDVLNLFRILEQNLGSHAAAADACGLTRKTAYDWQSVKDLKFDTKIKLLNTMMEKLPEETLNYLTNKSVNSASDILMVYLSSLYEATIDTTEKNQFVEKLDFFDKIKNQYSGMIVGKFDTEVNDKIFYLKQKAMEFNLNWLPKPSPVMTVEQIDILIPMIMREIFSQSCDDAKISDELNVPEELVKTMRISLQQTLTLSGVIPSILRGKLDDLNKAITSITNPFIPSYITESQSMLTAPSTKSNESGEIVLT